MLTRRPLVHRFAPTALLTVLALSSLAACSPAAAPPSGATTPWTAAPIPTPYASTSASALTAAAPKTPRAPGSPSIEQLLHVHRASNPHYGTPGNSADWFFLSDEPGTPQLYAAPLKKGDKPTALTTDGERVSSFVVAPDGQSAAVLGDLGGDENDRIFRVTLHERRAGDGDPAGHRVDVSAAKKVKHTRPAFDDKGARIAFTSNARNGKDMDLYVAPWAAKASEVKAAPSKPTAELSGSFSVDDFRGERVLMTEQHSEVNQDLWLLDARTGKKTALTAHTGDERYAAASFSADGKAIYVLTDAGREFMALVRIDVATQQRRTLYAHDHDVTDFALTRDNVPAALEKGGKDAKGAARREQRGVLAVNVDGYEDLHVIAIATDGLASVDDAGVRYGEIGGLDVSADGKRALMSVDGATMPHEIFEIDLQTRAIERRTDSDHAGVDESKLVAAELLTLKASDGIPLSLFWYAPPTKPGERLPVVMVVHGGPESQMQPVFSPMVQALVADGFAVAAPNVRGSMGYGKAFSHLDDKGKRQDSVRDLRDIAVFLAARFDVDGTRIALYGGSYGGYMVLAGLTLFPEQFAAGVDVVGIANFRTFLEKTSAYRRALREAEYGSLTDDGDLLDRISPIHSIDKIKAPLFLIHGRNDPRVPVGEAQQVHDALKARGLPVELMIFEDEGHGLFRLSNRLKAFPKAIRFLEEQVRDRG